MIRFVHGGATDVGRVRSLNEDNLFEATELFAVADGMGGHRGGEVASAQALQTFADTVTEPTADGLMSGVEEANLAVFRRASDDPELMGMGTTLCAVGRIATPDGERVGVVNVGDSRVYLLSGGRLVQISEDHSLVETMVRGGHLTAEQAAVHPKRNVITRALGIEPTIDVDCWAVDPRPGDRFLLCSDGLFGEVDDGAIADVLRTETDPRTAAQALVQLANFGGGRDNITCLVVDVVLDADGTDGSDGSSTDTDTDTDTDVERRITRVSEPTDDLAVLGVDLAAVVPGAVVPDAAATEASGGGAGNPASTAPAIPTPAGAPAPAARPAATPTPSTKSAPPPKRFTWRVAAMLVALVAVVVVAYVAVWSAATRSYVVRADPQGNVAVYKGRDLLWFDARLEHATTQPVDGLADADRAQVTKGREFDSLTTADAYLAGVIGRVVVAPNTAVPTTTSTTAVDATSVPATDGSATTVGGP